MYMKKSEGPKTEAYGTPCNTLAQLETLLRASLSLSFFDSCFLDTIYKVHNPCHLFHKFFNSASNKS